ncbi:nuclear transport factor 2 family protein [Thaumasiovibrio sp. DFM-14]|uniref:nuclear transport factor 2 family protein n=1 Tax=Thaumasiovibrio sp. DFM-14 TaxID=3384792 RepID=UPI0039A0EA37
MRTMQSDALGKFVDIYGQLNKHNLHSLDELYHPDIVFEDPAHRIEGSQALKAYFEELYRNINECDFKILHSAGDDGSAYVRWVMTLSHPQVESGRLRRVEGCTYLEFSDKRVVYHRDYFDLGALLYEGLPVLGRIIAAIKKRLGQ